MAAVCGALFVAASAPASADDYAPSDLTLAQILAKARTARGEAQPGAYVVLSHAHGGGEDSSFVTHVNGKDILVVETSGPFVKSYGAFQGQFWRQDENGTVLLSTNFAKHVDLNARAWEHPDDPTNRVVVLGITKTSPAEYVVEANPPWGVDQYRYYDATTMLLTHTVTFGKDHHRHVTTFDDYRLTFGQTRAYHTHYSDGRPANDTDEWIDSIARDASSQSLTIPVPHPLYQFASSDPVQLPARFTNGGIVVRATVANRGLDFILDSGASGITIDPGVAHDVGLTSYGKSTETIGGEVDISRAKVASIGVGSLTLNDVTALVVPMSQQIGDSRIVGLMGCDFFAGSVVGIDFGKETVTLYPRATFDPAKVGATAQSPIDVNSCVPRLPASVEGIPGSFLIDTGSFTTFVYDRYLAKLPEKQPVDQSYLTSVSAVGGRVSASVYSVSDVGFGPILFKRAQVVVPHESTMDDADIDGIFGRNILEPIS